ncbi:MAG: hypothetical protein OQL20_11170 [Sedimenticola sp.]|nr:hypothetical protein [Sedimenticola sp.]
MNWILIGTLLAFGFVIYDQLRFKYDAGYGTRMSRKVEISFLLAAVLLLYGASLLLSPQFHGADSKLGRLIEMFDSALGVGTSGYIFLIGSLLFTYRGYRAWKKDE